MYSGSFIVNFETPLDISLPSWLEGPLMKHPPDIEIRVCVGVTGMDIVRPIQFGSSCHWESSVVAVGCDMV